MNETKQAIQLSFIKIYEHKPFEKISIKEICINAPVARTTFYEYYENLAELKAEIEDTLINGILQLSDENVKNSLDTIGLTEYFSKVLHYIQKNWDVNYAFLVKQPNYEYMEKWKNAIKYHFKCRFPEKTTIPNYDVIVEVIASGVMGAYVYWMKHPEEINASKISEISAKVFITLMNII